MPRRKRYQIQKKRLLKKLTKKGLKKRIHKLKMRKRNLLMILTTLTK